MTPEAEQIVAWLRRKAAVYREMEDDWQAASDTADDIADYIEQGAHLKRPEPTIPFAEWVKKPSVGH